MSQDFTTFKILLVGDSGAGKSSLLQRFAEGEFSPEYSATIGVDFQVRTLEVEGKLYRLQVWDTAGQERFRTITSSYYRGANAIILVFDLSENTGILSASRSDTHILSASRSDTHDTVERGSLRNISFWLKEISRYTEDSAARLLVGAKRDLIDGEQALCSPEGVELARSLGIPYLECSAKTGEGVEEIFKVAVLAARDFSPPPREPKVRLDSGRKKFCWRC